MRRLVRPRVKIIHERDESLQARSLLCQLELLDSADVDGAFIHTFTASLFTHGNDPRHDLDTDSFSLVKTYPAGRRGTAYPDMTWEPKESFRAVASYYAAHLATVNLPRAFGAVIPAGRASPGISLPGTPKGAGGVTRAWLGGCGCGGL